MDVMDLVFNRHRTATALVGFVIIFLVNAAIFDHEARSTPTASEAELRALVAMAGMDNGPGGAGSGEGGAGPYTWDHSDYGAENSEARLEFDPGAAGLEGGYIEKVTITLTWTDEADASSRHTNQPDTMSLDVTDPEGEETSDGPSESGSLFVTLDYPDGLRYPGDEVWSITVSVGECGDQETAVSILGLRDQADDGNAYTVTATAELV